MNWYNFFLKVLISGILLFTIASEVVLPKNFLSDQVIQQDSLPYIKEDFRVNNLSGEAGAKQEYPAIALDSTGNYLCAWVDFRSGKRDIYAQMFDKNDNRIGSNFKVNDAELDFTTNITVLSNPGGDFAILWRGNSYMILLQRISNAGNKVGGNFIAYSGSFISNWGISGAMHSDGKILVVYPLPDPNLNGVLISKDNFILKSLTINDGALPSSSSGNTKNIDCDDNGNFFITWSSNAGTSSSKIYGQVISKSGNKIGTNICISSDTSNQNFYFPEVVCTGDGYKLVHWRGSNSTSWIKILRSDNSSVINETLLAENNYYSVTASTDRRSLFYILLNGASLFFKLDSSGAILTDSVKASQNPPLTDYIIRSYISPINKNYFFVIYNHHKYSDDNCGIQKYDTSFSPINSFTRLHDDSFSSQQTSPLVKFNNKGSALILWDDPRNGAHELTARILDSNMIFTSSEIRLNDFNNGSSFFDVKAVTALSNGNFIVVFRGNIYSSSMIKFYVQLVSDAGVKLGQNRVIDSTYDYSTHSISINTNANDEILVALYDTYGIRLKKFSKDLNPLFTRTILQNENSIGYSPIAVSIDKNFNVFVAWNYYNLYTGQREYQTHGQFYHLGNLWSPKFIIDSSYYYVPELVVANDGSDKYVVAKNYYYNSKLIWSYNAGTDKFVHSFNTTSNAPQKLNIVHFSNHKLLVGYNVGSQVWALLINDNTRKKIKAKIHEYADIFKFSNYSEFKFTNSLDLFNDRLLFTYFDSDDRSFSGYDVYSNLRKVENFKFGSEIYYPIKNKDYLYNNFPNPFNAKTKIAYQLLTAGKVKLTVYDILGREVKVLVDATQQAGIYEVDFDSGSLPSGVYFYRLEAFSVSVKKMLIIK